MTEAEVKARLLEDNNTVLEGNLAIDTQVTPTTLIIAMCEMEIQQ